MLETYSNFYNPILVLLGNFPSPPTNLQRSQHTLVQFARLEETVDAGQHAGQLALRNGVGAGRLGQQRHQQLNGERRQDDVAGGFAGQYRLRSRRNNKIPVIDS